MAEYRPGLGGYRVGEGEVGYGIGLRTVSHDPRYGMSQPVVDFTRSKPVRQELEYIPQVGIRPVSPQPRPSEPSRVSGDWSAPPMGFSSMRELSLGPLVSLDSEVLGAISQEAIDSTPAGITVPSGPGGDARAMPFTQLDFLVDSNGSRTASEAVERNRIRGDSIVRGVFGS